MKRCAFSVLVTVLLVGGCGHAGPGPVKPRRSVAAGPVELLKKWQRKADATEKGGVRNACMDAGSTQCATYLSSIMSTETGLQDEIKSAHAQAEYKSTMPELAKMNAAYGEYVGGGCEGEQFANEDHSCTDSMATVLVGLGILEMTMQTDEIKAGA